MDTQSNLPTTTLKTRTFKRHDVATLIPELVRRVVAAEFTSLSEVAESYDVDKATTCRWKARAISGGLIEERLWRLSMLQARLNREMAA